MMLKVVVLLLAAAGLGGGVWWIQGQIERLQHLQVTGVVVTADVVGTDMRVTRSRDSNETHHYARIRFTAPGGQSITDEVSISEAEYRQFFGATEDAPHSLDVITTHDGSDFMTADNIDTTLTVFRILQVVLALTIAVIVALAIRFQVRGRRRALTTGHTSGKQGKTAKQKQRLRKDYR